MWKVHLDPNMHIMVLPDTIWPFQVLNRVLYLWQSETPKKVLWSTFFLWAWRSIWPSEGVRAHVNYLMVGSFWGHLAHSWLMIWAHTMSLLWAFHEFATLTVSSLLPLHGELMGWSHEKLTSSSQCELQTHRGLTASSQCESSCKFTLEATEYPQNELSVGFNVSSQWVSCELKFFTG